MLLRSRGQAGTGGSCVFGSAGQHSTLLSVLTIRLGPPAPPSLPHPQAPRKAGLSKTELNRVKRGGKGKHGFKSKARHRRR